jgi:hypothetical protein
MPFLISFLSISLLAQSVSAPNQVTQGAVVVIQHEGATDPRDYVTIVKPDAGPGAYGQYKYCSSGNNLELRAPIEVGDWEVRLNRESNGTVLARSPLKVVAAQISLTVPDQVKATASFEVAWTGPNSPGDFITIVAEGARDTDYGSYVYTTKGSPVSLPAPGKAGTYEVRYSSGVNSLKLQSKLIKVVTAQASIEAPDRAKLGEPVSIKWEGPANDKLYVTIVAADARDNAYDQYQYISAGNPLVLNAPEKPGAYEIRFNNDADDTVLARRPLTVDTVPVSLNAPTSAMVGQPITVEWEGPANQGDFITIVAEGTREGGYAGYAYAKGNQAVTLNAPEKPGNYEIRYATGRKYFTLATQALTVIDTTASLQVPAQHEAGKLMAVGFDGPNNDRDYIAIVKTGDDPERYIFYANVSDGQPAQLRTPFTPGEYKVYYHLGRSGRVLAEATTTLTASTAPGFLTVTATSTQLVSRNTAVAVILDASGSMLKRDDGKRRIQVAKDAVTQLIQQKLPAETLFALRVFGHRQPNACQTDLEIPLGPLNAAAAAKKVAGIQAMNLAKTPIGASLAKISDDLAGHDGPVLVVLLTDGEETCESDPAQALQQLKQAGFDVQVNIVGFALDEMGLKQTFTDWARLGGGRYFDAAKSSDLAEKLIAAVTPGFSVVDSKGETLHEGEANGSSIPLPAGTYQLKPLGGGKVQQVVVKPDETTEVAL